MIGDNRRAFEKLLDSMSSIYKCNLDSNVKSIYWNIVKKYEIADIRLALERYLKDTNHGRFFPKPCDILMYIEGKDSDKAIKAWLKALHALSSTDNEHNKPIIFDDPIIHYCIDSMGGIDKFKEIIGSSQESFKRNEFIANYTVALNDRSLYQKKYINVINLGNISSLSGKYFTESELQEMFILDSNALNMIMSDIVNTLSFDEIRDKQEEISYRLHHINNLKRFFNSINKTILLDNVSKCREVFLNGKIDVSDSIKAFMDENIFKDKLLLNHG